mgnify:CR=1 FL=1
MSRLDIGILGGGISGLVAADRLRALGHEVVVFDKGRGPGGRASSRRAAPYSFDHGAQYFTARSPELLAALAGWLEEGVVQRWEGRIVSLEGGTATPVGESTERFVAVPQMNALAKHLAKGLSLRSSVHVDSISRFEGRWEVSSGGEQLGVFDRLVLAMPPAQAALLLGEESRLGALVRSVEMRPCWAGLLGFAEPLELPYDGAFCHESQLSWIARDSSKPGRPEAEAWVLHASAEWTEANLETDRALVLEALLEELCRVTGAQLPERCHQDVHRWGLAQPARDELVEDLCDASMGVVLAGGAYFGGRVEGAFLSGLHAAQQLV